METVEEILASRHPRMGMATGEPVQEVPATLPVLAEMENMGAVEGEKAGASEEKEVKNRPFTLWHNLTWSDVIYSIFNIN